MRALHVLALLASLTFVPGCRTAHEPAHNDHDYVLVYLTEGPHLAQQTKEESAKVFQGHMANIQRLADEAKLVVAGPFDHPHDKRWRGIFVMNVPTVAEAEALVATDPGVMAHVFTPEFHAMRASPRLQKTLALDREDKLALERSGQPAGPAAGVRAYVMLTAEEHDRAAHALASLESAHKLVWSARIDDKRGVFVLDAPSVADAETMLASVRAELGTHVLDSWWSTKALERLPTVGD